MLKYAISLGGQKDENRESRSEEKMVSFSSASLFTARKRETVNQGGTRGIDHRLGREPREQVSSKVGRAS